MRVPVSPHPHQHFVLSVSWIFPILTGSSGIVVLICNFFTKYEVEHLFICLFDICISFLVRYLFRSFAYLFIYLFLAELDLRCCIWAFSSCGERGLLSIALHRLLPAVASLVAEHGL